MKEEFNVSLKTLFEKELSFEAYFIVWCLYYKQYEQLVEYVSKCRKIPTEEFKKLADAGYITIYAHKVVNNVITFDSMSLAERGRKIFELHNFDLLFDELKKAYPSSVGDRYTKRRLHTDLKRCKNLYKKIIGDDINMHNTMCKCAILYHLEKKRSGSEMYMQNLVTWLHQENYLPYMEEANKNETIEKGGEFNYSDDI